LPLAVGPAIRMAAGFCMGLKPPAFR